MRLKGAFVLIFSWYLISALTDLPHPHEVAEVFFTLLVNPEPVLGKTLVQHAVASLFRVLAASFLAFSIAVPLGIISGWNRTLMEFIAPAVEALRPIPPLAWIPLAYIIFAPLPNTVEVSQIFIVFVGAFFPCFISVFDYARNVPEELLEMAEVFKAPERLIITDIVVPHSLQGIMSGVRIGLGVGWMSIIAAEMIATSGEGLGYFIMVMYNVGGRTAEIVAGMAMIGIIGYMMNWLLLRAERWVMPWR
ncbi:ABC transporter permease [Archaeoglobus fulgidus]|jgi:NitT/TauT family transport system permease protein|uniref:Nitrate ABC transporter, permease protein (NrtB-2) n=3 Tax=Archaeoglobus fulgidus TaxID=2234 RepID=O29616_ARCFU|nr:ABC transporter permease [Archaeoglobus fulgidus]AAB90597.1 nitrate ABC transporter, permease protein (nrtB-2) [Archaeoglobus fulgidus DSM 4304]AIG97520.1 ABC-type nitrate/sulfonate/bicarbonate transport system, permease component [Archaeoglobus fulgidus DSM 8774]KUJ93451.1 MAG: Nitrate ABC transporter, permease protein (NrtB-2) [Archaeoglobus fulgidus]KUK07072.1 MAG: Nitrate ABC transporter, permease protein (NrtB-2) [Archaeoglobus fulgidus]